MARIAIFSYSIHLAHAGRAVALGRALQERGHEVILVGEPRYLESSLLTNPSEFELVTIPEPDLARTLAAARSGEGDRQEHIAFAHAIIDESRALARLRPDLVIVDNRRSALVTATALDLPTLSLTNTCLLGPCCAVDPTVAELCAVAAPAIGVTAEEFVSVLGPLADDARVPTTGVPLPERIRLFLHERFASSRKLVHELNVGTKTMVLDVPSLYPVRDAPSGTEVVGPLLFDVAARLPHWWSELDEDAPIVHVTFESAEQIELFEMAIEELASTHAQVVVTTADVTVAVPDNVFVCRYLPGDEVMKRASLLVCDGGSTTLYHALRHGTPVLAIPTRVEQAMEAIPLVRAHVARALARQAISPGATALTTLAAEMLEDPSYRESAEALAARLDPDAALEACVTATESLLEL